MLDMAIMVEHTPNATKSDPEDLHQETKGFQIFWIAYSASFREFTDQKTKQISLEPNSELKMDPQGEHQDANDTVQVLTKNLTELGEFRIQYSESRHFKAILVEDGHFYKLLLSKPHKQTSVLERSTLYLKGTQNHRWAEQVFIEDTVYLSKHGVTLKKYILRPREGHLSLRQVFVDEEHQFMEFSPLLNGLRAEISKRESGLSFQGPILFQENIGLIFQVDVRDLLIQISKNRRASEK